MSTPGSNEIRVDAQVFTSAIVGVAILVLFIAIAWIFTHYVLKNRAAAKKKERLVKRHQEDVERGGKAELDGDEQRAGVHELAQPGMPELGGGEVKEMWVEGCVEEKDGCAIVVELQG